jgi:hypothetical protein
VTWTNFVIRVFETSCYIVAELVSLSGNCLRDKVNCPLFYKSLTRLYSANAFQSGKIYYGNIKHKYAAQDSEFLFADLTG